MHQEPKHSASKLAVIIATYNRASWLPGVLEDALAQLEEGMELLVIDQSDESDYTATARLIATLADPRVRHLQHSPPGLPQARNVGASHTGAPILIFLDDDVRLKEGCLQAHAKTYNDPEVGGVVGRILEDDARENAASLRNAVGPGGRVRSNLTGTRDGQVDMLKGANMSVRHSALDEAGGFDPGFRGTSFLEEGDLSERLRRSGWTLRFAAGAVVEHARAAEGGCRVESRREAEKWRFHNTGRFWRRNRPWWGLALVVPTLSGVALKRAWQWRDPRCVVGLMRRFMEGWQDGQS